MGRGICWCGILSLWKRGVGLNVEDIIDIALKIVPIVISLIALLITVLSSWMNSGKLKVLRCDILEIKSPISTLNPDGSFSKIVDLEYEDYWMISLRIVNPRPYAVSIFNINLLDAYKNRVVPMTLAALPAALEKEKLYFPVGEKLHLGLTLPESDYTIIPAGKFTHLDFVVPKGDYGKRLKLFFRDSIVTFFPHKMHLPNSYFMRHRVYSKKFNFSKAKQWRQLVQEVKE